MYVTHSHVESDRLGNQLFRLAATLSYSITHNKILTLKDWKYKSYFDLSFNCNYDGDFENKYHEKRFEYDSIPYFDGNVSLSGYYQSEKYFVENSTEIINCFHSKTDIKKSCAIHVRRGDYLNHPNIFELCDMNYYSKAIEKVNLLWGINRFVVYSDDTEWSFNNIRNVSGVEISYSQNQNYITDFVDMQNHYCNIVSNSTFSWWAAWLANHNRVIAPKKWFKPNFSATSIDIVPERWILI